MLHKKPVALRRKILLPRPDSSPHTRPITIHLFYSPHPGRSLSKDPLAALSSERNLIFDVPGGGFVSMGPEHHEERLRSWAVKTSRPVISIEYGKAPECKLLSRSGPSNAAKQAVHRPVSICGRGNLRCLSYHRRVEG